MIAWLIGIVTLILLLFLLWRGSSAEFRRQSEEPKFRFLANLGARRLRPRPRSGAPAPEPSLNPKEDHEDYQP